MSNRDPDQYVVVDKARRCFGTSVVSLLRILRLAMSSVGAVRPLSILRLLQNSQSAYDADISKQDIENTGRNNSTKTTLNCMVGRPCLFKHFDK